MLELQGPTNTRKFIVGVYFRGERLATGTGGSIRQAEMEAANNALKEKAGKLHSVAVVLYSAQLLCW